MPSETHVEKDRLTMASDEPRLIPPAHLIQMYFGSPGPEQYIALGDGLVGFLVQDAGLQPHHRILDVGCGIGLAARPLTKFLSASAGSYDGFDIVLEAIDWCRTQYHTRPHFRFQRADVYNKHYNPQGQFRAREYRFPYASGDFDMVVLASVFTHLLPDDMKNYLSEVARVMKPGGRCFASYFLLNPESTQRIDAWLKDHPDENERGAPGGLSFRWKHSACCRLYDKEVPETAVAYDENWIRELYEEHSLTIEKVQYGEWCRGSLQPGWQDIVLAVKR